MSEPWVLHLIDTTSCHLVVRPTCPPHATLALHFGCETYPHSATSESTTLLVRLGLGHTIEKKLLLEHNAWIPVSCCPLPLQAQHTSMVRLLSRAQWHQLYDKNYERWCT